MIYNLLRLLVLTIGLGTINAAMAQDSTAPPQLALFSATAKDMEPLPLKYTQTGTRPSIVVSPGLNNGAVNPPIEWSNVPPGDKCLRPDSVRPHRHLDVGRRQYSRKRPGSARRHSKWKPILETAGGRVSPQLPQQWLDPTCSQTEPGGPLDLLLEALSLRQEVERSGRCQS